MTTPMRRLLSRYAQMLGGEVVQSAFAFVLNLALVRALPPYDYGLFAIVILIGGLSIIYMRSIVGVAASTAISQSRHPLFARAHAVTFGSLASLLSLAAGLVGAAAIAAFDPAVSIVGGALIGAWSLRSYVRIALFAQCRTTLATASDFTFTGVAAAFGVPLILFDRSTALLPHVLGALTLAHLASVALAFILLGHPVRLSWRRTVRRRARALLPTMTWSFLGVSISHLQGQGPMLLIAAYAGPAAYAPIAATLAFVSPLRLAASALANMAQPDLASALRRPAVHRISTLLGFPTVAMALVCGLYGVVMILGFPTIIDHAFAGRFVDEPLAFIMFVNGAIAASAAVYAMPRTLLETVKAFREIAVISAIGAAVSIPTTAILLLATTPAVSLLGLLVSELLLLVAYWIPATATISRMTPRIVPTLITKGAGPTIGLDALACPTPGAKR